MCAHGRVGGKIDCSSSGGRLANFDMNDVNADHWLTEPSRTAQGRRRNRRSAESDCQGRDRGTGRFLELFNRDLWECDPETVTKRGLERVRSLVEA